MNGILGLVLLASYICNAAFIADVSPRSSTLWPHESTTLNCTLRDPVLHDASLLEFKRTSHGSSDAVPLPDGYEYEAHGATMTLHLNDLQESHSIYYCYYDGGETPASVFTADVKIGSPPSVVDTEIDCVMYNIDTMTCSWSQCQHGSHFTYYTLSWERDVWRECQQYTLDFCGCYFTGADANYSLTYHFNLTASNDFGIDSKSFEVIADNSIIQAGPVQHIAVTDVTSTFIFLTWQKHERNFLLNKDLSYHISYIDEWPGSEPKEFNSSTSFANITDLEPYTEYTFTIQTMVNTSPHVGNDSTYIHKTSQAAPSERPVLKSYRMQCSSGSSDCLVILFYQTVDQRHGNGPLTSHEVFVDNSSVAFVTSNATAQFTRQDLSQPMSVSVAAHNQEGRSPYSQPMTVQHHEDASNIIGGYGVTNGTITTIHWSPDSSYDDVYLLSCEPENLNKSFCKDDVRVVHADDSPISINSSGDNRVYALYRNHVGPMTPDWICIYQQDEAPDSPVFELESANSSCLNLIITLPNCDGESNYIKSSGHTESYSISYSKESCQNTADRISTVILDEISPLSKSISYPVCNLEASTKYSVCIEAMGITSNSEITEKSRSTVSANKTTVIVFSTIGAIVALIGVIVFLWVIKKRQDTVPIDMPKSEETALHTITTSEYADHTRWDNEDSAFGSGESSPVTSAESSPVTSAQLPYWPDHQDTNTDSAAEHEYEDIPSADSGLAETSGDSIKEPDEDYLHTKPTVVDINDKLSDEDVSDSDPYFGTCTAGSGVSNPSFDGKEDTGSLQSNTDNYLGYDSSVSSEHGESDMPCEVGYDVVFTADEENGDTAEHMNGDTMHEHDHSNLAYDTKSDDDDDDDDDDRLSDDMMAAPGYHNQSSSTSQTADDCEEDYKVVFASDDESDASSHGT